MLNSVNEPADAEENKTFSIRILPSTSEAHTQPRRIPGVHPEP